MTKLTKLFSEFFENEKAGGLVLIFVTVISLVLSNTSVRTEYIDLWHYQLAGQSLVHWINDGLMTIFFLLIGLELEREIYQGELSSLKNAALPFFGALGGMLIPAAIFLMFNFGTSAQAGAGIPMATDIAFAIGILSLLGSKVPASLKVFLTALAVIDDLGAIIIIAVFYTQTLSWANLFIATGIFTALVVLNRIKVTSLWPYLIGGVFMWYFMLHSGVHATITGVLLAFAIPFGNGKGQTPSNKLLHFLHKPVAFFIVPLFALANTSILFGDSLVDGLVQNSSLGIIAGLIVGKPLGITLFALMGVSLGICTLPSDLKWSNIVGAGMLGGIGFTMSIFITLLAYSNEVIIDHSKIAILAASCVSGLFGFVWLKLTLSGRIKKRTRRKSRAVVAD